VARPAQTVSRAVPAQPDLGSSNAEPGSRALEDEGEPRERGIAARLRHGEPSPATRADVRAAATRASPAPLRDEAREAPIVRVTIGRVEIRAAVPPAPAASRPAAGGPRPLSLNDYLAGRKGGSR
jgi:hypothetical protein